MKDTFPTAFWQPFASLLQPFKFDTKCQWRSMSSGRIGTDGFIANSNKTTQNVELQAIRKCEEGGTAKLCFHGMLRIYAWAHSAEHLRWAYGKEGASAREKMGMDISQTLSKPLWVCVHAIHTILQLIGLLVPPCLSTMICYPAWTCTRA
eukprot:4674134-Amphidinium_carterae.2